MAESKGWNPIRFATEVRQEASKVTWTTWQETLITTIMVFVMVVLAGIFFYVVDTILRIAVDFLIVRMSLGFGA
jgi:preprotein translocase subunit SecE